MDVVRRNTDYAIRLAAGLVGGYGKGAMSAKSLAQDADIPFEIACKLLQKLAKAKLVKSTMGKAGGFELAKAPSKVRFYDIIAAIQGGICLNRCVADPKICPRRAKCPVSRKLAGLQNYIEQYLKDITLSELLK